MGGYVTIDWIKGGRWAVAQSQGVSSSGEGSVRAAWGRKEQLASESAGRGCREPIYPKRLCGGESANTGKMVGLS